MTTYTMTLSDIKDIKDNAGVTFILILSGTLFLLFLDFGITLGLPHISLPFKVISALADSSLIATLCVLLKGRWRFLGAGIVLIVGGLLLANLLYYRNFDDLLQASSYLNAEVGDPAITEGATSSFRASDTLFLILPLCPLAYLILDRRNAMETQISTAWKLSIASFCLIFWCSSYVGVLRRARLWNPDSTLKEVTESIFSKDCVSWCNAYELHNFTGYAVKCILSSLNTGMDLSPSDISDIKSHIAARSRHMTIHPSDSAPLQIPRNLIMIIVESLPFKVIEKPEVSGFIPTITNILNDSTTIVSRCTVLADYGRSSDAQFIYNTGLLPLRSEALVDNYAGNDYPSLAKALKIPSLEIIGERKGLWNHSLTTKSYGFDRLLDNTAPSGMDQDSLIFKRAEMEVSDLDSPFYLFLTSISMHDPYDEKRVTSEISGISEVQDARDREFYARLNHFDRSLGQFLAALKQKGLHDDSVIVILGDHEIRKSKISRSLHDDAVPFIIINSPIECKEATSTTQLDVFPSLLDVMGTDYRYLGVEYSGLGQSIFSAEAKAGGFYKPTATDYSISEMIIKGRPAI